MPFCRTVRASAISAGSRSCICEAIWPDFHYCAFHLAQCFSHLTANVTHQLFAIALLGLFTLKQLLDLMAGHSRGDRGGHAGQLQQPTSMGGGAKDFFSFAIIGPVALAVGPS
jgi:hypothetical protein